MLLFNALIKSCKSDCYIQHDFIQQLGE